MLKILVKTFDNIDITELINFFSENKIEAKFQNFSNDDEIVGNFIYCLIKIDFEDSGQYTAAKKFIDKNKHLRICAYLENMNKNTLNLAHSLGCHRFCYDLASLKNLITNNSTQKKIHKKSAFLKFRGAKILIVDDVQINLDVLKDILAPFCFEIHAYIDARAAFEKTETTRFDLIFLDITMPEINGFDFAKKLKTSKLNATTGVIFVTGNDEINSQIMGYSLGSVAYVKKPLDIETLRAQVYGILETKALQNEIIEEKENFIQMLTHDLKTPINAQLGAVKLLLEGCFGDLNQEQREILIEILASNKYMLTMVRNVLTKYRHLNCAFELVKSERKINDDIAETISNFRFMLERKGLKTEVSGNLDIVINYDQVEIMRVINNLLSNAIEHCAENSIIKIKVRKIENAVSISVINKGREIIEEDLYALFDKYTTRARKYRKVGFGLGLYICKEIIEAHGGKIWARVEECEDCKNKINKKEGDEFLKNIIFEFTLPIAPSASFEIPNIPEEKLQTKQLLPEVFQDFT